MMIQRKEISSMEYFLTFRQGLNYYPQSSKSATQTAGREAAHRELNLGIQTRISSDGVIRVPEDKSGAED